MLQNLESQNLEKLQNSKSQMTQNLENLKSRMTENHTLRDRKSFLICMPIFKSKYFIFKIIKKNKNKKNKKIFFSFQKGIANKPGWPITGYSVSKNLKND
jgi:hypothetical protein